MIAGLVDHFLDDLDQSVSRYLGATSVRAPSGITVAASGRRGFDMALLVVHGECTLCFDGWKETFSDIEQVRGLFEAALRGTARLKVDTLSGKPWRWTLERLDEADQWIAESTIGHPTWRFWGEVGSVYLRNVFPQQAVR